jgi:hypothetical protein
MITDRAVNKEDMEDKSLAVSREDMEVVNNREAMGVVKRNMGAVNKEETFLREASKSQPLRLTSCRADTNIYYLWWWWRIRR